MSRKDVKSNLLEHSEVKVRLLGNYLKRYLAIISNLSYIRKIRVYDLFCGEGIYENGGEGSPLIILRGIKALRDSGVIKHALPPIDCQFNDKNLAKVDKVKGAVTDRKLLDGHIGTISYTSLDYQDEVKTLQTYFPTLKNEKVFVFIDPYGYKHIKASDIKALLKSKNSEVLLFLPVQHMYRFDARGTPEALKDFIEDLTDYKNWKAAGSSREYIEQLKEAFRNYLGSEYFVDTFTIKKDAQTVFCLFFFSSHIRGFEKMLEAKWEIDQEQGIGWEYSGAGQSLFAALKTNPLELKLKKYLEQEHTNAEVYEFTLHAGFLPKHTFEVFENWQNAGSLKVTSKSGEKQRKRSFYISFDNYTDNPDKVKFKI